jgi:hypothetical protein
MASSLQTDAIRLVRGMAPSLAIVSAKWAAPSAAVTPRFHGLTLLSMVVCHGSVALARRSTG